MFLPAPRPRKDVGGGGGGGGGGEGGGRGRKGGGGGECREKRRYGVATSCKSATQAGAHTHVLL